MNGAIIRPTTAADAALLPDVERSAGESFRAIADLAWLADDTVMSVKDHQQWAAAGTSWVAEEAERPVGFLTAEATSRELHVWELAVDRECQGRGLGRRLMAAAIDYARERGLDAVTLTTFRDVPWNQPFYSRLGFATLEGAAVGTRLQTLLRDEQARGLPRRCAMRLSLCST